MTATTLRKEGGTDCTGTERRAGLRAAKQHALMKLRALFTSSGRNRQKPEGDSKLSKAMRKMLRFHAREEALSDAVKKECDAEEEHYGRLPDRSVPYSTFEERQFGDLVTCDVAPDFPCSVVSIALFDGDTMLFACSGIPLPRGRSKLELTRYVTSACLATQYISKRYRDDKLRIEVRLPNGKKIGGFLELYNRHIAIVTSLGQQNVHPVDVDLQTVLPSSDGEMLAAGRAFRSGCLMAAKVKLVPCSDDLGWFDQVRLLVDLPTSQERLNIWKSVSAYEDGPVAVLGGPVLGEDKSIIGMSVNVGHDSPRDIGYVLFLPLALMCRYLKHFQILKYIFYASSIYELYFPLLAYTITFASKPLFCLASIGALGFYVFNTVICMFIIIWFLTPLMDTSITAMSLVASLVVVHNVTARIVV